MKHNHKTTKDYFNNRLLNSSFQRKERKIKIIQNKKPTDQQPPGK